MRSLGSLVEYLRRGRTCNRFLLVTKNATPHLRILGHNWSEDRRARRVRRPRILRAVERMLPLAHRSMTQTDLAAASKEITWRFPERV
ncbi:hypothetical protein RHA1_ro07056 [Rhodococcus jostii RHA1]|uniref:Uncharacterized protein n=1 Tax=Rhodococcus jostii (strain RHA1) TaxID=101510 RepID=Q0S0W4_RHOJR|nr:hypothetical protein RHA1_ro07056 [Rhodococcus jostii RHA1]